MMSHPPTGALLTLLVLLAACDPGEPPAPPTPEVLVVKATHGDVPVISEWLGTTEGFVDAAVRAQVSGYLIAREYREGQLIKRSELLFRIDPRPFQAALNQAQGQLASARATLERERLDVVRYTPLVKQGAVSQQEYDNAGSERARRAGVGAGGAGRGRGGDDQSGFHGDPLVPRRHRRRRAGAARRFRGTEQHRPADGGLAVRPDPRVFPAERAGIPALRAARRGGAPRRPRQLASWLTSYETDRRFRTERF
jgi:hypothetical protein